MLNKGTTYEISDEIARTFSINDKTAEKIEGIAKYSLTTVTQDLSDDLIRTGRSFSCEQAYPLMFEYGKCDARLANRLELEFKRFCILTLLNPGAPHAPPGAVDMYWHFFILHSKEYNNFCVDVWGDFENQPRFRDHFPSKDATRPGMLEAYKATRALYVIVFGEPKLYEMQGIHRANGEVLPVAARHIWSAGSDTSGDSYSGTIEPN